MAGKWLLAVGLALAGATTAWSETHGRSGASNAAGEGRQPRAEEPTREEPAMEPRAQPPGRDDPEWFYRPPPRERRLKTLLPA